MDYISSNPSNSSLFFQDYNRHNNIKVIKKKHKSYGLKITHDFPTNRSEYRFT